MNVFEKIKYNLMILAEETYYKSVDGDTNAGERNCAYHKAIKIVDQVAEEYNNGWISCEVELPPQPKENPLFENKALELYLVTTKYGSSEQDKKYPFRAFWNGINFTDGWNILDVIAWQPIPEPYQQKGD